MKKQILKLRDEGKTYDEIVTVLGCSKSTVSYHCGKGQKRKTRERKQRLRSGIRVEKEVKLCLNCKTELSNSKSKYCNSTCFRDYQFKNITLPKFYKGEIHWNSTLRKILIYLFGNNCSKCSQNNIWNNGELILEVDHIDGNSDNCKPDNIRLLCPNCHSQTETSNGKNSKKNTRRNKYLRKYKTAS